MDVRFPDRRRGYSGQRIWRKSPPNARGGAPFFLMRKGELEGWNNCLSPSSTTT